MILIIYISGCILSFGRMNGSFRNKYYKDEIYCDATTATIYWIILSIVTLTSWVGLASAMIVYLIDRYLLEENEEENKFIDFKLSRKIRYSKKTKAEIREERINDLLNKK